MMNCKILLPQLVALSIVFQNHRKCETMVKTQAAADKIIFYDNFQVSQSFHGVHHSKIMVESLLKYPARLKISHVYKLQQ